MNPTSPSDPAVHDVVRRLLSTRVTGRAAVVTAVVRILAGAFMVLGGIPKFVLHDLELAEFVSYGLPASSLLVHLVGVLEIGAGLMLALGALTRVAAAALAANMAGAVLTAGVQVGGPLHLGVAPTLLLIMLYLVRVGSGAAALDARWSTGRAGRRG